MNVCSCFCSCVLAALLFLCALGTIYGECWHSDTPADAQKYELTKNSDDDQPKKAEIPEYKTVGDDVIEDKMASEMQCSSEQRSVSVTCQIENEQQELKTGRNEGKQAAIR